MMIHLLRDIYFDHLMWFSIIPSRTHSSIFSLYYIAELDIWSWSTIWHIMHLIYELYFNIYVEMCLFDVVASDVKEIEKNVYFCIFLFLTTFSSLLPISFIPDPRRYIRRHDICIYGHWMWNKIYHPTSAHLTYFWQNLGL